MKIFLRSVFSISICLLLISQSYAQQYSFNVGRVSASCSATNGQPVPIYTDPWAAYFARQMGGARADFTNFGFTIAIDPGFLLGLPPLGALFTFYHECAHVSLPMGIGLASPMQERNADCYAVQFMRTRGMIRNWRDFEQAMSAVIRSSGGHYVDVQRISAMSTC